MTIAEYIDRDAVYTAFANAGTDVLERASELIYIAGFSYEHVIEILDDIPTVNVAPVVHGKWIDDVDSMICSECGMKWNYCDNDVGDFCYCPNCGSRNGYEVSK